MDLDRILRLPDLLAKKSFFLFGPRATGKSWLVRKQLGEKALVLDLLRSDLYLRLSADPGELAAIVAAGLGGGRRFVVIDEVQRVPELLNEVHRWIEEKGVRFLLTGSSARKLRRGNVNLLAGRAWTAHLFPVTWKEIPEFDLDRYLRYGGLPSVVLSGDPEEELRAYAHAYLYEEIQAEGLVRKLPQFSRFLIGAALSNGRMLNFAKLGSEAGLPASTIREYYSILEDTLLGFALPPWTRSRKRRAIATAKFYLFDPGVTHALAQTRTLDRNSDLYGRSFEQWIGMELRAYLSYARSRDGLSYWRSIHQQEVDFVIGDHTAVEVKAARKVASGDVRGLLALREEKILKNFWMVSQDPVETRTGGVACLHYRSFLSRLWQGDLF